MTAYVRSGVRLVKRRRVVEDAERGLRAAIQHATVKPRHVERVRAAQLGYLKALRHELETGAAIDEASQALLASAAEADRAWRAATAAEIVAAYASGTAIAPGRVPITFAHGSRTDS